MNTNFDSGFRGRPLRFSAALVVAGIAALQPLVCRAQQPPAEGHSVLEEIIVTAEKRESTVQRTPAAIVAISGENLADAGVDDTLDLTGKVPGLFMSGTEGGLGYAYLRGVGTAVSPLGADQSIAIYVDGAYRPRSRDAVIGFLDVARVEVLKGPQGTLYGRNAAGGAINIISNEPSHESGGSLKLTGGNLGQLEATGVLNLPLVQDKVLLRVAAQKSEHDGFTENLFSGAERDLDDKDVRQTRVQLRWIPRDDLDLMLSGSYFNDRRNQNAVVTDPTAPNAARDIFGGRTSSDIHRVYHDFVRPSHQETWDTGLRVRWAPSDALSLASLSSYREGKGSEFVDADGTDIAFSTVSDRNRSEVFYQELLLTYEVARATLTSGVTYFSEEAVDSVNLVSGFPIFAPMQPPSIGQAVTDADVAFSNDAYGVFAQGTYHFTDRLRGTAGLRYSSEKKDYDAVNATTVTGGPPFPIVNAHAQEKSWDSTTPLGRLEYDVTSNVLTYLTVSKGFKSGGFNTITPLAQPAFEPESLLSYELGVKSRFLDRRAVLNVSAFYYDYADLQVQVFRTGEVVAAVQNASDAEIYGLDVDFSVTPIDRLTLSLAGEYLQTEYQEYFSDDPFLGLSCPVPSASNPNCVNLAGRPLDRAPETSLGASVAYALPLGSTGTLTARADWSYRSSFFFSSFQRPWEREPASDVGNLRLAWESPEQRYTLEAFVNNVTDTEYRTHQRSPAGQPSSSHFAAPRTYGLTLRAQFGQ